VRARLTSGPTEGTRIDYGPLAHCEAASWTSRNGTPASKLTVTNTCLNVCDVTAFAIPAAADPAHDPPGAVPVQPLPVIGQEHRPVSSFPGGQVDRPGGARRQRDGDDLAACG
jgi:hypothetical protein